MDRLESWRIFGVVARELSFVGAARALGRSPQAITRAIAALEARIGRRLFHRTTRAVALTSDGAAYLAQSQRALAAVDELEAPRGSSRPAGVVTITAPVLFGQLHVAPIVCAFLARHADCDVRLVLSDRVLPLAEHAIDVAVRIGALRDSALRAQRIGEVRLLTCASPAYLERAGIPRTPEALADHACIAFDGAMPIGERWAFPHRRRPRAIAVHARLTVNTGQCAIDAAAAGLGVARVLSYQVEELLLGARLRTILDAYAPPPLPIHLVRLPAPPSRAAAAFLSFAGEALSRRLRG